MRRASSAFLTKTNALALAIGVIIGVCARGAGHDRSSTTIIMPPIGWLLSGIDFAAIKIVIGTQRRRAKRSRSAGALFLNALIVFIVVACWSSTLISEALHQGGTAAGPFGRGGPPAPRSATSCASARPEPARCYGPRPSPI